MRIDEYQQLAMRTSTEGHDRVENGCLGLIGESGEIVDVVKKWRFQSGEDAPLPADKLIDECGDVLWYCAELAEGLGGDISDLYKAYGQGYTSDIHPFQSDSPVAALAVSLSQAAMSPYCTLYMVDIYMENWKAVQASSEIGKIMRIVRDILEIWCHSTLEEAMERNIEKLRRRYPDGFDPERSLHRAQ